MSTKTDERTNWRTWSPSYETAPPAACQTLRNYLNVVEWGYSCVFGQNGEIPPFSINTSCMPWVTSDIYPNPSAFYSPATACPSSWTAIARQTTGDQWVNGESAIVCCPTGFEGNGRAGCTPIDSKTFPVVQCGRTSAAQNTNRVYTGGSWPTTVTNSVTALKLRYQASDVTSGSARASGSASASPTSSGGSSSGTSSNDGGLSTGAIAAIGTVVPLVFIIGALIFFFLWRRKRQGKENVTDEKPESITGAKYAVTPSDYTGANHGTSGSAIPASSERPEWNVEMDAVEAQRQGLYQNPASTVTNGAQVSELGGTSAVTRKPVAPVEIDGRTYMAEVGDTSTPHRPGGVH